MIRMPNKGDRWSRDEMILVLNLYFQLSYGQMHHRFPAVQELAQLMGRTDNSVALRLNNFAACDPFLQSRGIKAMGDQRKRCQPFWDEFNEDKEALAFESERILAAYQGVTIEDKYEKELKDIPKGLQGEDRIREVKTRVNQKLFRKMVLANYDRKCALTGIDIEDLLVASHIIPWADNKSERLNPQNGICLSSMYDKAFDKGLISFRNDGSVLFSEQLKKNVGKDYYYNFFEPIMNRKLLKARDYLPNPSFLEYHRDSIFNK